MESIIDGVGTTCEVLLCTYNGSRFIEEQLTSIANQSQKVDLISIYDDCSTDDTLDKVYRLVDQLRLNYEFNVRIHVNKKNLGYRSNFQQAIKNAQCDILFLCDQDDFWDKSKVETVLAAFRLSSADMVFSDGIPVDRYGQRFSKESVLELYGLTIDQHDDFSKTPLRFLIKRNFVNGAALAIQRIRAQESLPLPKVIPHDYWLAIFCALYSGVHIISAPLYYYRQHEKNTIGLSGGGLISDAKSIWRYPVEPRLRELRIWFYVCKRLKKNKENALFTNEIIKKLEWLEWAFTNKRSRSQMLIWIAKSLLNADYKRFSIRASVYRDFVSIIRWASRNEIGKN